MALWKGIGPILVGVVPARSIYFSVYSQGKHTFTNWNNGVESSAVHMFAAAVAGSSVAVVTNPIWLVKTRMVIYLIFEHSWTNQSYTSLKI